MDAKHGGYPSNLRKLKVFSKGKYSRRILGTVKEEGQWRMRYNRELYELYKDVDLVTFIKFRILQWAGHVQRLPLD
jgi:hypothetical protein